MRRVRGIPSAAPSDGSAISKRKRGNGLMKKIHFASLLILIALAGLILIGGKYFDELAARHASRGSYDSETGR